MDSLTDYVTHWFHHREFYPYFSRGGWRVNAAWLAEEERGRPGFTNRLRALALQYLGSGTPEEKVKALRILAVAAMETDLTQLQDLTRNDQEPVQTEARRALRRIQLRHSPARYVVPSIIAALVLLALILTLLSL